MFETGEIGAISKISHIEMIEVLKNPFMIIIGITIITFAVLNCQGGNFLQNGIPGLDMMTFAGLGNEFYFIAILCSIVATFIGVWSVSGDRSNNTLKVLLTKPLYMRDIIIGKYIGITTSVLMLITASYTISSLLEMLFYGGTPGSIVQFVIRMLTLIFLLYCECSLVTGVMMLMGILFKNMLLSTTIAATYFFIEWFADPFSILSSWTPWKICNRLCMINNMALFNTSIPYINWLNEVFPYIIVMILAIISIVIIDCYAFMVRE